MRIIQSRAELLHPWQDFVAIKAAVRALGLLLSQRLALHMLHYDDGCLRVLLEAKYTNDIGMRKFHPAENLLLQVPNSFRIAHDQLRNQFERDGDVENRVLRQNDQPHSTSPQLSKRSIPPE